MSSLYQFRECQNSLCRFRFPVDASAENGDHCPLCNTPTRFAAQSLPQSPTMSANGAAHRQVVAVLDNLRSVLNVGSIFRSADGAGIEHLHLCGTTATPDHPKFAKTALGAETNVSWSYHRNGVDLIETLQANEYTIWALEATQSSQSLFTTLLPDTPLALVVGNERAGIDPDILALCHRVLHLPMCGVKESLNVAVAFGIAAYHLTYQMIDQEPN
ncbi:MAG: RNA methyltransferase [Anaerolineae bacterium]|nr:RNA methyltransferase [Anaerolineae bacterium]